MPMPMSFPAAMKHFFGLKPGQVLKEFMVELRTLDDADRAYFKAGLEQNGYEITSVTARV